MAAKQRIDVVVSSFALLAASAVILVGLASYGLWDPWEIDLAERARAGRGWPGLPLDEFLIRASLGGLGGSAEWAGRLPNALAALLTVLFIFALGARSGGSRVGAYSALVAATTPLILFNGRTMIGHALPMAAQAGLGLALFSAAFPGQPAMSSGAAGARRTTFATAGWLTLAAALTLVATLSAGLLRGVLPPLVAVAVLTLLDGRPSLRSRDARDLASAAIIAAALAATFGAALVIAWDRAGHSNITGGEPTSRAILSFEAAIEQVLHGFAPWSALLFVGFAHAIEPRVEVEGPGAASTLEGARHRLALFSVLWIAGGYIAAVLYDARYGAGPFVPVAALALLVGSFLVSAEESGHGFRLVALLVVMLVGLLLRDFALYPGRPLAVLSVEGLAAPEDPNRKLLFGVVLGIFAASAVVSFGVAPSTRPLVLGAPYRFLREQWERGLAEKAWLLAIAAILVFCAAFGAACLALGDRLEVGSLAVRIGRKLFFLPAALPLGVATAQIGLFLAQRLGPLRLAPLLLAGLACGAYLGHGYLPVVGEQYSSREIYEAWNELRGEDEALMTHGMETRSSDYYAEGEVRLASGTEELVDYLAQPDRRWAAFAREHFSIVNARFRARSGRHLFVSRASTSRTVLVSNRAIEGQRDDNPLAQAVRSAPPASMDRRADLRFGEQVELIGYDLELPRPNRATPGEPFTITWYWRARERVPSGYKIFVHIDGPDGRINGDHDPASGSYPVSLWQPGDVIADRQQLSVPSHFGGGEYVIYVGLWRGPSRLPVTAGEEDGEDRAVAGKLLIR